MQFKNPPAFQERLLAGGELVTTPAQIGFPEMVMVGTGDMARTVLGRDGDLTGTAPFFSLGELVDFDSLSFTADHAAHVQFRSMMRPAFSSEAINGPFLPEVERVVGGTLAAAAEASAKEGGGAVPGYATMKRMTFEIIMTVMMGRAYAEAEIDRLQDMYTTYTAGMMTWPMWDLPFLPYGKALVARKQLVEIFGREVSAAQSAAAAGRHVPGQLGVMVAARDDAGKGMEHNSIVETLLVLLFAGHDTTSTSITHLVAILQDHPEVVEKLRAEQRELVAKHGPGVSAASLKEMTYADAVIRESLRVAPIANEVFRLAKRDFEMGGYKVPQGATISAALGHAARHDPRWEGLAGDLSPDAFNPERMLTPEGQKPGDQMPFGHGPRYCLGAHLAMAEMKVFLALLAQGYRIEADTNTEWSWAVAHIPRNGLPLVVEKL